MISIEPIGNTRSQWGEGPVWWHGALYYVDIEGHKVHRLDPADGSEKSWDVGQRVGTVVPRESGGLVIAGDHGLYFLDEETGALTAIADPEPDKPDNRFNDGKCSPDGRFFAGTISLVKNQLGQVLESGALSRENTDVTNYGSWQPGHPLHFHNMPLNAVCRQLERMYSVRIELPEALNNKRLTASSHYDTLPNILDKLALSLNINYQIKDGHVIIKTN